MCLYICSLQLLDEASMMTIMLGSSSWDYKYIRVSLEIVSLTNFFASHVWLYSRSLGYPTSGFWPSRQWHVLAPSHSMGLLSIFLIEEQNMEVKIIKDGLTQRQNFFLCNWLQTSAEYISLHGTDPLIFFSVKFTFHPNNRYQLLISECQPVRSLTTEEHTLIH